MIITLILFSTLGSNFRSLNHAPMAMQSPEPNGWAQQFIKDRGIDLESIVSVARSAKSARRSGANLDCANGNFDAGDFSGWTFSNLTWIDNKNNGASYFQTNSSLDPRTDPWFSQYALVPNSDPNWANWQSGDLFPSSQGNTWSPAMDPNTYFSVPFACGGGKVLRLGNPAGILENKINNGHDGETATFAFTVTPNNLNFGFRFAAFIEDHNCQHEPAFDFYLVDSGASVPLLTMCGKNAASSSTYPVAGTSWHVQPPTAFVFHIPNSCIGKTLYAVFKTTGCAKKNGGYGDHSAYAFIDDLCDRTIGHAVLTSAKTDYCDHEPILLDGSCSVDATNHTWTVQQCNASGTPVSNTAIAQTKTGRPTNAFDLKQFLNSHGVNLKCNAYYRVTLKINPNVEVGYLFTAPPPFFNPQPQSFVSVPASMVIHVECSAPTLNLPKANYCRGEPITVDTTGTASAASYSWTLSKLDANGNAIPTCTVRETLTGNPPVKLDLTKWYEKHGQKWMCDADYRISLRAFSTCSPDGSEAVQNFRVNCCRDLECCKANPLVVTNSASTYLYPTNRPGEFGINPVISRSGSPKTKRLDVAIVNAVRATNPWSGEYPVYAYFSKTLPVATSPNLIPTQATVPFMRVARWESTAKCALSSEIVPLTVRTPPPTLGIQTFLKLTLKFTTYDADCGACETYQTYAYRIDQQGPISPLSPNAWPKRPSNGLELPQSSLEFRPSARPNLDLPKPVLGDTGRNSELPASLSDAIWSLSTLNCCGSGAPTTRRADLRSTGSNTAFAFSPLVTTSTPTTRIEATIVSAAAAVKNGPTQPVFGFIQSAAPIVGFAPPQLCAPMYSHGVRWVSSGSAVANLGLPMKLVFPSPPVNGTLYLRFTMRFAFSMQGEICRQCETYQNYFFRLVWRKAPAAISPVEWPSGVTDDGGPPPPTAFLQIGYTWRQ